MFRVVQMPYGDSGKTTFHRQRRRLVSGSGE
jgi:hypothetical protein